ncbi:MAG TPA: SRPBCC family protein [Thermodesulfobacteriota bacterium]|nr:SRPBCC family protein [Thermodesulfobacteriota bacterium]
MQTREDYQDGRNGTMERLANSLGWFSIGLGLAEVIAPRSLARLIGLRGGAGTRLLLRFYGVREIAAGVGILAQKKPSGWLWGRVGGDVVDLASLGLAMTSAEARRGRLGAATAAVAGVTALDVYCGQKLSKAPIRVTKSIIINKPPEEVYAFWRDPANLPRIMPYLESVEPSGSGRLRWTAKGLAGRSVQWEEEIINDEPNSRIAWRSADGSAMETAGAIHFERATGGRGTLVRLRLGYTPPGGTLAANIAKMFGMEPGQHVENALRRMKQILETGGIVKSDASIFPGMHAAQPPEEIPGSAVSGKGSSIPMGSRTQPAQGGGI